MTTPLLHDPYLYHALVRPMDVYDGDSVTASIDLGFGVWLHDQKLRLWGINAPEVRGASRKKGQQARDHLKSLLPEDGNVYIRSHKDAKGKYGRWLAEIIVQVAPGSVTNVNSSLVAAGHAVHYMRG